MEFFEKLKALFTSKAPGQAPVELAPPAQKGWYSIDGFEAATWNNARSYIQTPGSEAMVNPSQFTRREIIRMSRYLVRNYPLAKRIASLCSIYGVGAGISANASTSDPDFNKGATLFFSNWANSVFSSSDNETNFYQIQRIIATELLLCGEVFIVLEKAGTGYPQVRLVRSEDVEHSGNADDTSVDGVYFDSFGKALAYNIPTGKGYQKIDAGNVIHVKHATEIGQKRGVGMFASSLNAMRDHKDMATLIKRGLKTQLTQSIVITKKVADAQGGLLGTAYPVDGISLPATGPSNRGLEQVFTGGNVNYMQEGEDVKLLASDHPTENVMAFVEQIMREVCLSVSLPFEFVVNADKLTGTGIRFAISDAAAFFASIQDAMIDGGFNRIYSWVISSILKQRKLSAPANGILPFDVTFTRPCSVTVDQGRMDNSAINLLQAGLLNREAYWSARGKDWKQEADQLIAETKYLMEQAEKNAIPLPILIPLKPGTAPADTQADTQLPDKTESA
jgi:capsid protein